MKNNTVPKLGITSKFCSTFSKEKKDISSTAQGDSEKNISVIIQKKEANPVHVGFYLSSHKTISIGFIGVGSVGGALLDQINKTCKQLKLKYKVNFSIRGIMNSKKMVLSNESIFLNDWKNSLNNSKILSNIEKFIDHITADDVTHAVIIDCTANMHIANQYMKMLEKGIHIITPNKHANSGDIHYYKNLKSIGMKKNVHYLYEATVCAGLPIINTLQDLMKTGDEVVAIEGIVSGTFSYIFNEMAKGRVFSEVVLEAKQLGFTEPDPREDLSGYDVARKLICLAREIGRDISFQDIQVHSLIPDHLKSCSLNEFLERLSECDQSIGKLIENANLKNEKICYVGSIQKDGKVNVSIESYSQNHPFSRLQGTDNMLIISTQRYNEQPLIIQGPGAGAEVTAAGVFADLLRLSSSLF